MPYGVVVDRESGKQHQTGCQSQGCDRAGTHPRPQSTAARLGAHGVTPCEREIATLIAQGATNPEIAEALVLSPYTVQDNIKNLFNKARVSSRQELVAHVFLNDCIPDLPAYTPLTSTGSFAQQQTPQ